MRSVFLPCVISIMILGSVFLAGCEDDITEPECPDDGENYYSAQTQIGDLYEFCFGGNEECRDYALDLLLYLDTVNLNETPAAVPSFHLQSVPGAGGQLDHVFFAFNDSVSSGFFDDVAGQTGWKAYISNARIDFCETCYTNCGLAKIIELSGEPGSVEFVFDPADTLEIFINSSLLE